jgi:hypothetical protein
VWWGVAATSFFLFWGGCLFGVVFWVVLLFGGFFWFVLVLFWYCLATE